MIVSFDQIRLDLRSNRYPRIGSGSGRLVYAMGSSAVVKVAKNRKGYAQNKAEYQIGSADRTDLFAKILALSENNELLVMERASQIDRISVVWKYFHVQSNYELFRLDVFRRIAAEYNLLLPDLRRPENWGIIGNRPVIVDYGFTRTVKRKYYSLF